MSQRFPSHSSLSRHGSTLVLSLFKTYGLKRCRSPFGFFPIGFFKMDASICSPHFIEIHLGADPQDGGHRQPGKELLGGNHLWRDLMSLSDFGLSDSISGVDNGSCINLHGDSIGVGRIETVEMSRRFIGSCPTPQPTLTSHSSITVRPPPCRRRSNRWRLTLR